MASKGMQRALGAALMAATALAGSPAMAKGKAAPSALEARLARMEAEIAQLRADLATARAGQAQATAAAEAAASAAAAANSSAIAASSAIAEVDAKATRAATGLAALEKRPAPEGFRDGGNTVRLGGYVKLVASTSHFSNGSVPTNTLGRDFYLPQAIPTTVNGRGATSTDFSAKQARIWLNLDTTLAGHTVKGYLESDFQTTADAVQNVPGGGTQRTTNGYTLALRRAYVTLDRFTFGQDWTTFQYVGALPETTDYVGGAEGTVFVRQPLVRLSLPVGKRVTLHVSAENPESGLATAGAGAILESGTDHMPDFAARLAWTGKRGELSLAALVRQVRGESNGAAVPALVNNTAASGAAGSGVNATGFGASLGGKLFLAEDKSSDVRFIATYGKDIGRYVGLNFAPDAVFNPATGKLTDVSVFAALVAARLSLTSQMRINLMGSFQHVGYDKGLTAAQVNGLNRQAWSLAANLFYSPVKAVDVGIEYRHGERTVNNTATVSGEAKGKLDRIEFAAKYSF